MYRLTTTSSKNGGSLVVADGPYRIPSSDASEWQGVRSVPAIVLQPRCFGLCQKPDPVSEIEVDLSQVQ
jgi:hypothetical protein